MDTSKELAIKTALIDPLTLGLRNLEDDLFQAPNEYSFTMDELKEYAQTHNLTYEERISSSVSLRLSQDHIKYISALIIENIKKPTNNYFTEDQKLALISLLN